VDLATQLTLEEPADSAHIGAIKNRPGMSRPHRSDQTASARPGRLRKRTNWYISDFGGLAETLENPRTPGWITSMHYFMLKLDGDLKEAGRGCGDHGSVP